MRQSRGGAGGAGRCRATDQGVKALRHTMVNTVDEYEPSERVRPSNVAPHEPFPSPQKEYFQIGRVLGTLMREKWLVLTPVLLAFGLTVAYSIVAERQYTARAQLLIDTQKPKIIAGDAIVPGLDMSRFMIDPVIQSEVEILRSPEFAARVIRALELNKSETFGGGFSLRGYATRAINSVFSQLGELLGLSEPRPSPTSESDEPLLSPALIETFQHNLDVRRLGLTLILSVQYTDTDPEQAARLANAAVNEYLAEKRQSKFDIATKAFNRLNKQVVELNEAALLGRQRIQDYAEANNLASIGGLTISEREISATLIDLVAARGVAAGKLAELQRVEGLASDRDQFSSVNRVLLSTVISSLRQQEAQLERQLATLISQFGERHFEVDQKRAELAGISKEINKEVQRSQAQLHEVVPEIADLVRRRDYANAVVRVKLTERALTDLKREHARRTRLRIGLFELEQDSQTTNAVYKSLLARLKEAHAQLSLLVPDARSISNAARPQHPSSPKIMILLVFGLVGGLGVGITLALIRDHTNDAVHGPDDVEAATGLSLITSVPALTRSTDMLRVVIHDTTSQMSQAMFKIKHAILLDPALRASPIVAIVSPNDGEGKSTIAANLAHYMALSGTRTLLIDCDLRTPDLTGQILPNPSGSVVDILSGKCTPGDVIVPQIESGFFFCPGPHGDIAKNPMELLASPEMSGFLSRMAQEYEIVILDTSSMLRVVDARALVDSVDTAVLVVEEHRTTRSDLRRLISLTPALIDKAVGAVTNKSRIEA